MSRYQTHCPSCGVAYVRLGPCCPVWPWMSITISCEMSGNPLNMKGEEFYLLKGVLCVLPPIMIPVVLLLWANDGIDVSSAKCWHVFFTRCMVVFKD